MGCPRQDEGELCVNSAQCKSKCCHRTSGLSLARCAPKASENSECSAKVGAGGRVWWWRWERRGAGQKGRALENWGGIREDGPGTLRCEREVNRLQSTFPSRGLS